MTQRKKGLLPLKDIPSFNTNTAAGSIIVGLVAAMEEQRANGMDIGDDTINSVKVSLMGPVAGLGGFNISGDTFSHTTVHRDCTSSSRQYFRANTIYNISFRNCLSFGLVVVQQSL